MIALHRWLGRLALAGVLYFLGASIALQFLRPDYNFMGTPLSFYLLGAYSGWLQAAFFILAGALIALATGYFAGSARQARSFAAPTLFIIGAAGVVTVVTFPTDTTNVPTLHGVIHVVGATVAFLCVSFAMLIQSWHFRRDPHWQKHFHPAMALAAVEFIVLWTYALARIPARGFMEKLTILLILAWLALAAWWLQQPRAQHAALL